MFWNDINNISISSYSMHHIDLSIRDENGDWRVTGFYGHLNRGRRHITRNLLRQLANLNNQPWMVIGDFNDLLTSDDKRGRVAHPQWLFRGFREAVTDCNLVDLPLIGYKFTWFKSRGSSDMVEERLDRAMGNPSWHGRFSQQHFIILWLRSPTIIPFCWIQILLLEGSRREVLDLKIAG